MDHFLKLPVLQMNVQSVNKTENRITLNVLQNFKLMHFEVRNV